MAFVPIYIPWTTKPPVGTPIDWSNSLTQGLVVAEAFNERGGVPSNSVTGAKGSLTNAPWAPTGVDTHVGQATIGAVPSLDIANCISVISEVVWDGTALSYSRIFSKGLSGIRFELRPNLFISVSRVGGDMYMQATGATATAGAPCVVAGTISKLDFSAHLYKNGVAVSTGVINVSSGAFNDTSANVPAVSLSSYPFPGVINCLFVWNRILSPVEVASLSANPWQIYQPQVMWVNTGDATVSGNTGASTSTLDDLTGFHAGQTATQGQHSISLTGLASPATGVTTVTGQSANVLAGMAQVATGVVGASPIAGQSAVALANLATSHAGQVATHAQVSNGLEAITSLGTGVTVAAGQSSGMLTGLTQTATGVIGTVPVMGQSVAALVGLSVLQAGTLAAKGTGSSALAGLITLSQGSVLSRGVGASTLIGLAGLAAGRIGSIITVAALPLYSVSDRDPLALRIVTVDPLEILVTDRDPLKLLISEYLS
jgi:hypothetical protein